MPGKYIVLEGLDGSGKSTQHQMLLDHFGDKVRGVREPGGTPMAEAVRSLVKQVDLPRASRTNVYLFNAARAEVMDSIVEPTLASGVNVIADRNWLSTVAYQSAEGVNDTNEIYQLCKLATRQCFEPDLLLFIDVDVATCRKRLEGRGGVGTDYFDKLGADYFEKVRETYMQHITKLPNYKIIDGNQTVDQVFKELVACVDMAFADNSK